MEFIVEQQAVFVAQQAAFGERFARVEGGSDDSRRVAERPC